jgi:hypothetical protein
MDAAEAYAQALSISCRVTAMSLVKKEGAIDPSSNHEIVEMRKRLLSLPASVREDHQGRMILEAQKKLRSIKITPEEEAKQKEIIRVLQNLDQPPVLSTASLKRVRYVLPQCAEFISHASAAMPELPSPVCHKDGLYSPTCIATLKKWNEVRAKREAAAHGTPLSTSKDSGMISTF